MYLLDVKDIKVLYGKAIAINGLSIYLRPKELVGVVGPNGAGKTTLLRAISAVLPVEGEILFEDRADRYHEAPRDHQDGDRPLPRKAAALHRIHR